MQWKPRLSEISKKHKIRVFCFAVAALLCCLGTNALADTKKDYGFSVDAALLSASNSGVYEVELTVASSQMDLEGMVRVAKGGNDGKSCVYDTVITLPKDSEKKFTVTIPTQSIQYSWDVESDVYVQIVDKKGKVLAEEKFRHLLENEADFLTMGILSDNYSSLTYFDLGGDDFYFYQNSRPIKLHELKAEDLENGLSGLTFLMIDQYDTGVLSEEQLLAIENWVDDGGALMVGTGQYAENTLAGMEDFLGISCYKVREPYNADSLWEDSEDDLDGEDSWMADPYYDPWENYAPTDYYYADLLDLYGMYSSDKGIDPTLYARGYGNGAIGVSCFSPAEVGSRQLDGKKDFAYTMLEQVSGYCTSRYDGGDNGMSYYGKRLLGVVSNSGNSLNTAILDGIVFLYVILVGPVLYLILRAMKKREWYWAAVPTTALFFVLIISFAGRGFEVKDTRVISVSTARADGKQEKKTYMQCYDAGHNEWLLRLQDSYTCVGPSMLDSYDYDSSDLFDYYYHVKQDAKGISFGADPKESFEDLYFFAQGKPEREGSIEITGFERDWAYHFKGTIRNDTDRDFSYIALMYDKEFLLLEGLRAGEEVDLASATPIYQNSSFSGTHDFTSQYLYSLVYDVYRVEKDKEKSQKLAALGIGSAVAYAEEDNFVMGLVENYDKVVDDRCSEISYGCLYSVINE